MLLLLHALACAPHPARPATAAGSAPAAATPTTATPVAQTAPATIRPPVSLETFRAAFPVGSVVRLRVELPGKPPVEERWEWVEADAEGCTIASTTHAADGTVLADGGRKRSTWTELLSHADFPADRTVVTDATAEVPAGRFATWLYTLQGADEAGTPEVRRFHFAKTLPGPPVLYTVEQAGAEVFRMTLLERTPRP